jgi:hypothetical protein
MRTILAAMLAAISAQPAAAQDYMPPDNARSYFEQLGKSGMGRLFWGKSMTDTGPSEPVIARITAIVVENDCEMAIRFENIDGGFAPVQSPIFLRWGSVKKGNGFGSYIQLVREYGSANWGIAVDIKAADYAMRAVRTLMEECGGDRG